MVAQRGLFYLWNHTDFPVLLFSPGAIRAVVVSLFVSLGL